MDSPDPFDELSHLFRMSGEPKCHFEAGVFKLPIVHVVNMLRTVGSFFQIVFGKQITAFQYKDQIIQYDWSMTIIELMSNFDEEQPIINIIFTDGFEYKPPNVSLPKHLLKSFHQVVSFWCTNYLQPPSRAHVFTSAFQIYVARMLKSDQIILQTTFTAEGVLGYLEDIVCLAYPSTPLEFWPNNTVTKLQLGDNPKAMFSIGFRSKETEFEE